MAALPDTARTTDLYERYAPRIFGYCVQRLGSREEAEDAVQTTFLNAFRGLSRGVVPESESAWLFKIAENVCLSRHRASFRRRRVEAPGDLRAVEETVAAPARADDELIPLEEALADMPETQRRALLLREWQGLSYREIASQMDVSQSAVETLIFRARRSLARRLEAPRERLRRVGQAIDVGSILAALKGALSTGAVVKGAFAAAAVTGLAVGAAVDRPQPRRQEAPPPAARRAPPTQPVVASEAAGRADAPLARAPQATAVAAAPALSRRSRSRAAKPVTAKRAPVPSRSRVQHVASAPARTVSPPPAPAAPASPAVSSPAKPGKAHEQQADRGRPARPAKPEPQPQPQPKPKPKAEEPEPQPAPPEDPGGQGKAKGKEK